MVKYGLLLLDNFKLYIINSTNYFNYYIRYQQNTNTNFKTENIIYSYNENEIKTSNGKYGPIKLNTTKYIGYFEHDEIIYSYMPDGLFKKYRWKN